MDDSRRDCIDRETRAAFDEIEQAANSLPGVLDLLKVYGGYEAAQQQIDVYLDASRPRPVRFTSNSSTA